MNQIPLLNTASMASTKAMRHVQRARTQAAILKPSPAATICADKSPVQTAALKSSPSKERYEPSPEIEFNITDEDRVLTVLHSLRHCEHCGSKPSLERKDGLYRVACYRYHSRTSNLPGVLNYCKETLWFKSSAQAIAVWKAVGALSK